MTPFGKPAAEVTLADLCRLNSQAVAEGRHLEFKRDIPANRERQRRATKDGLPAPTDRGWTTGGQIGEFGRDRLLRELVAFANADGGLLILGLKQTDDKPPRADGFNPLPMVADLEDRLRNLITDCIEPRLPYAAVKAIVTEEDQTSGVVVIEIEPSRLGPHWVRTSREATVRREESSASLTMPEIHSMVIRNARRFDDLIDFLERSSEEFDAWNRSCLNALAPDMVIIDNPRGPFSWAGIPARTAFAIRITIVPHDDLGIPRLENYASLVPPLTCLKREDLPPHSPIGDAEVWLPHGAFRRVLAGVEITRPTSTSVRKYRITRDGRVELFFVKVGDDESGHMHVNEFASAEACVIAIYCMLRSKSGFGSMPAELGAEARAFGRVRVVHPRTDAGAMGEHLAPRLVFPRHTIGQSTEIATVLNEDAADLMNAADLVASLLPRFGFTDPTL